MNATTDLSLLLFLLLCDNDWTTIDMDGRNGMDWIYKLMRYIYNLGLTAGLY